DLARTVLVHLRRADGIEVWAGPVEPVSAFVDEVLLVEAAGEGADAPIGRRTEAYLVALVRVPLMVGPERARGVAEPGRPGGRPPYGITVRVGPCREERVAGIIALVVALLPAHTLRVQVLIGLGQQIVPVVVDLVEELATHTLVGERVGRAPDLEIVVDRTAVWRHDSAEVIHHHLVGRGAGERAGDVVDVAAPTVVVGDYADGELIGDHRDVQNALDRGARIAVRGRRIGGADVRLDAIELRLVGDVSNHPCLRSGSEQRPLRALEDLDTLEIGGVDVEVAAGNLARLIVVIRRDVRVAASRAYALLS